MNLFFWYLPHLYTSNNQTQNLMQSLMQSDPIEDSAWDCQNENSKHLKLHLRQRNCHVQSPVLILIFFNIPYKYFKAAELYILSSGGRCCCNVAGFIVCCVLLNLIELLWCSASSFAAYHRYLEQWLTKAQALSPFLLVFKVRLDSYFFLLLQD